MRPLHAPRYFLGIITIALLTFTGCKTASSGGGCFQKGPGISSDPITGTLLPAKTLSIVFVGGPSGKTLDIIDYLYSTNVKAAFFVYGYRAKDRKPTLIEAKRKGHLVGNATFSGKNFDELKSIVNEVMTTDELITPYVTGNMYLFTTPDGKIDLEAKKRLNRAGLRKYTGPVYWDIGQGQPNFMSDAECWKQGLDIGTCADKYLDKIKVLERGIVAFHSQDGRTLEVVKLLIQALEAKDFKFVRLDEVPEIRAMIKRNGGQPGVIAGTGGCNDY